jgi:hypothetical protein
MASLSQVLTFVPGKVTQTGSIYDAVYATGANTNITTYPYTGVTGAAFFQYFNPCISSGSNVSAVLFSGSDYYSPVNVTTSGLSSNGYVWITLTPSGASSNGNYTINTIVYK